jgi:hypothetical protein
MLKTLASGHPLGMASVSPSQARCGWAIGAAFENRPERLTRPAAASAAGDAGMTPPLAETTVALARPPRPISHRPGTDRLATRKAPAKA